MRFDVIVVGAGHAGVEAAYAAARLGCSVGLCTLSRETVAHMPCNPAVGGTAKGHLVREIDALGGLMGRAIDATGIQFKLLNRSRGPAVWSPRAQADKQRYALWVTEALEREPNISWIFGRAGRIEVEHQRVVALAMEDGDRHECRALVITTGTFLNGLIHIGSEQQPAGQLQAIRGIRVERSDLRLRQLSERDLLRAIAERHDLIVISDEIYDRLVYGDHRHEAFSALPGMRERTILLGGFSKAYAMTGWRLGYGVMPAPLAEHVARLMVNSNSCTASFTQLAGIAALQGDQTPVAAMVAEFKRRRDLIVDGLNTLPGVSCRSPKGAFYVFPNVKALKRPSAEVAEAILTEAGVAVLGGQAFGEYGEGYLRLSYANSAENIRKALDRMRPVLARLAKG